MNASVYNVYLPSSFLLNLKTPILLSKMPVKVLTRGHFKSITSLF
jgi:hypothetical protein